MSGKDLIDMLRRNLKMKIISSALCLLLLSLVLSGCSGNTTTTTKTTNTNVATASNEFDSEDMDSSWNEKDASVITLSGDSISLDGSGATVSGTTVTILTGGVYVIKGTLDDGQIIVDSDAKTTVRLVLDGVSITDSDNAPIYVKNAEKTIITLAEETSNTLTDGQTYTLADGEDEPSAALFSKDDLIINGTGKLTVNGNYNHAIKSKDDIKIVSGNITVTAVQDAINAGDNAYINDGTLVINAGDDGIHSDGVLTFYKGTITVESSNEAIEAANITINDGTFRLAAKDDGINTVGGTDTDTAADGRMDNFNASDDSKLNINGGYIYIDAQGDGIDVNGDCVMTDGTVIVNGPTNNGNGALDYNGSFTIKGGILIAAGSSGMAQAPDNNSTQPNLKLNLGNQSAGTLVNIQNADGESILTFAPNKTYASVVFSSPELQDGATYTVYTGGSSTGTATDGLYKDGEYTGGTQITTITVDGAVTAYGQSGNAQGGPGGGQGGPGGRQGDPGGGQGGPSNMQGGTENIQGSTGNAEGDPGSGDTQG